MKIDVLTLFPSMYRVLDESIIGKALQKGLFAVNVVNIRDYSLDKHKKVDDYPYGGGAGMVMMPGPLHDAIRAVDPEHRAVRIYLSPKGQRLDQKTVIELAGAERLVLVNGSYEGIDERVIQLDIDLELSIGDYVLTSGDYASLVLIDAVARYLPDVLGSESSTEEESFSAGLLEYPHYTRPREFEGLSVPEVLVNGNHQLIAAWRKAESERLTRERRPDLLER